MTFTIVPEGDSINLLTDLNKGISGITYNFLGKPAVINFTDGRKIEYTYDATGNKLTMKSYQGTTLLSTTDYVGGFVYENANLSFYSSPEGRVVMNGSNPEHQYAIKDHQGNTRVVFTSVNPTTEPLTASFEGTLSDDSDQFENLNINYVVPFPIANHTPSGTGVLKMDQNYKTGLAKSMKVFPGDVVDLEVWAYFEGSSGFGTTNQAVTTLITSVAGAFGGVSSGGGESGLIYDGVEAAYTAFGTAANLGDARPTAYLNYILFDRDYNLLDMGWQPVPASANFSQQKVAFSPVTIKEAGYIYVYLSYEGQSNNPVFFDDLKITHTKTNVVQYNEYYPYGLQASTSWTREGSKNDFLYNDGAELNATSGWYETFYRGYDPALGRFLQVDPKAAKYASISSYSYAFNEPVFWNDPYGDDVFPESNPNIPNDWMGQGGGGSSWSGYTRIGPGSGNHWTDQYRSGNGMDAVSFMNAAIRSENGGYWSGGSHHYYTAREAREVSNSYYYERYSYLDHSTEDLNGYLWTGATVVFGNRLVMRAEPFGQQGWSDVEVFIWSKMHDKDVGHTAIKVGDIVYGYYPTDVDGDGAYTLNDLNNSPGEMHINSMKEFNKIYNGNEITAFRLSVNARQGRDLIINLLRVASNPEFYSLTGNQCTSIAYNSLVDSGIGIINPNLSAGGISTGNSFGLSPSAFQKILSHPINTLFGPVQSVRTFTVK